MIDVKDLSENPDKFRASQRARGADESVVDAIIAADSARRAALIRFENLRAEQNVFGKKVAQAKGEEKQALLAEVKVLAASVKAASAEADLAQAAQEELLRDHPQPDRGRRPGRRRGRLHCGQDRGHAARIPRLRAAATTWRSVS